VLPQRQAAIAVDGALVGGVEGAFLEAVVGQHAAHPLAQRQAARQVVAVAQVVEDVVVGADDVAAVDVQRQQLLVGAPEQQHAQAARDAGQPGRQRIVAARQPVPGQQGEDHRGSGIRKLQLMQFCASRAC
jgi:hypothetical protein